jgi:xanthine dehydrogenase YagR molybdenum-binding subunit
VPEEKTVRFPAGIVNAERADVRDVERTVPVDEPPPLPVNAQLRVIGKRTPRLDGRAKVTGAARYTADIRLPGMLFARVVRSPHPHARIRSVDTSAAERHPGVRAVHVLDHIRGSASLRDKSESGAGRLPVVRYAGQPVAAVAAITEADAEEAAALVRVDYEPLPFVVDLDEAMREGAPLVFPGPTEQPGTAGGGGAPSGLPQNGNVRGPNRSGPMGPPKGDVALGFKDADVVVEGTFRTQVQTHSALEPHGVVADARDGMITIYASTQGTSSVRNEVAEVFGVPNTQVRVLTEFMGGGFGSKFGIGNFGVLATHLSKKAKAPVRLMLDRREEHIGGGNRPSSRSHLRIGAKKDGTLLAIHHVSHGSGGAGTGAGAGTPSKNMYPAANILIEEHDVFTNAGPAAAFRAPGYPQGVFALEQVIDELAEKLGIDPLVLRDKIDFDEEQGGKNIDSNARRVERKMGADKIGWSKRHAPGADPGPVKRGMGMAQALWVRVVDLDSSCDVRIHRDGSVEVATATQDIGGGIRTALAQVVAEELGLRPTDITVRLGDTNFPAGPGSGGSRTTGSITPAARNAAWRAKTKLFSEIAAHFGVAPEQLATDNGQVVARGDGGKALSFRAAAARMRTEQIAVTAARSDDYGGWETKRPGSGRLGIGSMGGVQFVNVAVDTETGVVKVERVVAAHDCGRPINPLALESQINGGVLQGISYALYEDRILDKTLGHQLNANLEQYKILGARETPQIDILLIEEYRGRNSTDATGIGEPATVPTAAAVANAVYNAIGVRIRELPITPARVLEALARKGSSK